MDYIQKITQERDELKAELERARAAHKGAVLQKEAILSEALKLQAELQSLKVIAESYRAKIADLERLNIVIDPQGTAFGKNCWIAHDAICPSENSITSRAYQEWFASLKLTKDNPRCPAHAALEGETK